IDFAKSCGSVKHFWLDDGRPFRVRLSCSQTSRQSGGGRIPQTFSGIYKRIGNKLRRLSGNAAETNNLGGFLGTPHEMIVPLLDLAKVGPDTAVIDLGCGDARVLIEAYRHFGCTGIGYELDGDLASRANRLVAEAELTDKVKVVHGDALESELSRADVVFAFLPVKTLPRLIESVLKKMRDGAVLLCHEQEAFSPTPASEKYPIITRQGASIAHIWHS
ncbi:MAG: class I SAM-dependent methyltransferase, partial [Planctomycetota bacterium]